MRAAIVTKPGRKHKRAFFAQEPDREWLWHEYRILNKTIDQIAKELGCSAAPIEVRLRRFGIRKPISIAAMRMKKSRLGQGNPAWKGGISSRYQQKTMKKIYSSCQWCGDDNKLHVHHLDHNRANCNLRNLTVLCGPCHRAETWMWHLKQSGRGDWSFDRSKKQIIIEFTN